VQIKGSTLIVSSSAGDTTVTYAGSTVFTQTRTGSVASITTGACVVATGSKQSDGSLAVDTVRLSQQVNGTCAAAAAPGFGGGGGGGGSTRPSPRAGFTPPPQFANRASVRGLVVAVAGTSVSVQTTAGSTQSITIPTTVTVTTVQAVQPSSLQTGQCLLATGPRDASGTVSARTVTIVPAGPSGCFTGRGAFGGGGFGGGSFGGGGFGGGGAGGGGTA